MSGICLRATFLKLHILNFSERDQVSKLRQVIFQAKVSETFVSYIIVMSLVYYNFYITWYRYRTYTKSLCKRLYKNVIQHPTRGSISQFFDRQK